MFAKHWRNLIVPMTAIAVEKQSVSPNSEEQKLGEAGSGSAPDAVSSPKRKDEYSDGRPLWDWPSKYPAEARRGINCEALFLLATLVFFSTGCATFSALSGQ